MEFAGKILSPQKCIDVSIILITIFVSEMYLGAKMGLKWWAQIAWSLMTIIITLILLLSAISRALHAISVNVPKNPEGRAVMWLHFIEMEQDLAPRPPRSPSSLSPRLYPDILWFLYTISVKSNLFVRAGKTLPHLFPKLFPFFPLFSMLIHTFFLQSCIQQAYFCLMSLLVLFMKCSFPR